MRMRHAGFVIVALLSLPAAVAAEPSRDPRADAGAQPEAADDPALRLSRQRLASAEALLAAENFAGAFRAFDAIARDPALAALAMADQRRVLSHAGYAALRADKPVQGRDFLRRATALGSDDAQDWYRLMLLEERLGNLDRARDALRKVVATWPERIPDFDQWAIPVLVYQADLGSDARYHLMQALFDAGWRDTSDTDSIWYHLAVAQVARGRMDDARRTLQRIDQPGAIVRLRADKRFDLLLDRGDAAFDPVLAARRRMERLAQASAAAPDAIEPIEQLGHTMLALGMFDDVVALADRVIDRIVRAPAGTPAYVDMDNQVWIMNLRADALFASGRNDEALAELERARSLDEEGQPNVSQTINLADYECRLQRPKEALRELAHLEGMSGLGRLSRAAVEHCVALQIGNLRMAKRALDEMRRHAAEDPLQLLDELLREGRMDEATTLSKSLLADPYRRGDMLAWMQDTRSLPPLPADVMQAVNRNVLLARPSLVTAIDRVGRIEQYALYE